MMKNLGKIVTVLLLVQISLIAGVKAVLDSRNVEVGEMVTYSLHITGTDISRPNIQTLCGVDVISTSSQSSIEMIGANISRKNILSYKFIPLQDCTIEPIEVEIDDKIEKSNSVKIRVSAVVVNKDSDFILTLQSSKKEVFVGESFDVVLLVKQRKGAEAIDHKFVAPELKGFWVKGETQPQRWQEGNYSVTKIIYTMAAQRVGKLKISKAQMRIASRQNSRDSWGSWMQKIKWKTYFSNEIDMSVVALPSGVSLVGDFSIIATVDRQEINANEALNLTIKIVGEGNLEDIKSFKPYIDGVNIFDEKIVISRGILTQKIAFVGDRDFTIEPFSLKFFNPQTKEIKTISTDKITVKVNNAKAKEELTIKRDEKPQETQVTVVQNSVSNIWFIVVFFVGLLVGLALMFFKSWNFKEKKKTPSIKDPKVLLIKLLPYKDDMKVQEIINSLEKSIYEDSTIPMDKKKLKDVVEKYNIH